METGKVIDPKPTITLNKEVLNKNEILPRKFDEEMNKCA